MQEPSRNNLSKQSRTKDDRLKYRIIHRNGKEYNKKSIIQNKIVLDNKGYITDLFEQRNIVIELCKSLSSNKAIHDQLYTLAESILDHNILKIRYNDPGHDNELISYILQETNYSKYIIDIITQIIQKQD